MKRFYELIDDSDLTGNIFAVLFIAIAILTLLTVKYDEWQTVRETNQIQLIFGVSRERNQESLSDRL